MALQTDFSFQLPRGYLDSTGQLHQSGQMRLATALDEIESLADPRVQANEAYLPVVLLSRVVTCLGAISPVSPQVIAGLFASDLVYLEELYLSLNTPTPLIVDAICPHCSRHFQFQTAPLGMDL
jgi:hypothetical protein